MAGNRFSDLGEFTHWNVDTYYFPLGTYFDFVPVVLDHAFPFPKIRHLQKLLNPFPPLVYGCLTPCIAGSHKPTLK